MRAAYIEARGPAESIKIGTLPTPEPGPGRAGRGRASGVRLVLRPLIR